MYAADNRTPADGATPAWSVLQRVAATLLLALHAALAWSLRVPGLTTGHDDAWYLALARAVRLGTYADLPIVGTPTHSMYPPLYPVLLAVLGVDRPQNIAVGVAVNVALSVLALGLAALFAARSAPWYAIAMLVVCAPNPLLLERASSVSSEPLVMAATFLALLLLTGTGARTRTRMLASGAVAVLAATLSRSIGVSLLLATLTHWLLGRQWRRAAALVVAGALTTGAWLLWTVRAPRLDAGRSHIADAMYTGAATAVTSPDTASRDTAARAAASDAESPTVVRQSLVRAIAERVRRNLPAYITRETPSALAVPTLRGTPVAVRWEAW